VKVVIRRLGPILAALVLAGCWRGRLLVCTEPPFRASLGEPFPVELSMAARSLARGYWPVHLQVSAQENPRERLTAALATGRFGTAVVGPLLSLEAAGFAQGFPKVRFILVGGTASGEVPSNAVTLAFDRVEAFRLAGEAARLSLGEGETRGLVGVVTGTAASNQDEEVRAFLQGAGGGGQPLVRTVEQPLDEQKVKAAMAEMRRAGVEIFLLRIAGFEVSCLEALRDGGGSAVLSDWAVSQAFPRQVFLSVEERTLEGIGRCLGRAGTAGGVVSGPVSVVCGTARPVPKELKRRIDCR
jgi:hypothetical protein